MTFIAKNKYPEYSKNIALLKYRLMDKAKELILFFPMYSNELKLEKYLIKNYKTTLKYACLAILKAAKINSEGNSELIITFPDKRYDKLAALITYGNLEVQGSKILQLAFS